MTKIHVEILEKLFKKPLSIDSLNLRLPSYAHHDIETALYELIRFALIVPRDHKFFLRDRSKALTFINAFATENRSVQSTRAQVPGNRKAV